MYLDSSVLVGDARPPQSETINSRVTTDDFLPKVRRQLKIRESVSPAGASETTSANSRLGLAACDRIVRLPELLAIFQISRTTAYEWQKAGRLPHSVALGPRARGWKLSDIERFLASLSTEPRDD
ncbi:helix-turn-helix transcriptional regulator [Paraburkholderia sp. HD33-4]|uniref:helix-turn-helix transcriptional regulator n=1 Tax=Paraburkholderia sp. HD33-4 TaxID=2883242 RepID=UPI001F47AAE2|nr:AlpA family phage regulatory protein [Paraburkholderia sp. HD33-4]